MDLDDSLLKGNHRMKVSGLWRVSVFNLFVGCSWVAWLRAFLLAWLGCFDLFGRLAGPHLASPTFTEAAEGLPLGLDLPTAERLSCLRRREHTQKKNINQTTTSKNSSRAHPSLQIRILETDSILCRVCHQVPKLTNPTQPNQPTNPHKCIPHRAPSATDRAVAACPRNDLQSSEGTPHVPDQFDSSDHLVVRLTLQAAKESFFIYKICLRMLKIKSNICPLTFYGSQRRWVLLLMSARKINIRCKKFQRMRCCRPLHLCHHSKSHLVPPQLLDICRSWATLGGKHRKGHEILDAVCFAWWGAWDSPKQMRRFTIYISHPYKNNWRPFSQNHLKQNQFINNIYYTC